MHYTWLPLKQNKKVFRICEIKPKNASSLIAVIGGPRGFNDSTKAFRIVTKVWTVDFLRSLLS